MEDCDTGTGTLAKLGVAWRPRRLKDLPAGAVVTRIGGDLTLTGWVRKAPATGAAMGVAAMKTWSWKG